jgi:hypothetical protein
MRFLAAVALRRSLAAGLLACGIGQLAATELAATELAAAELASATEPVASAPAVDHLAAAKRALAYAETQRKFGLYEQGNAQDFEASLAWLDRAAGEVALVPIKAGSAAASDRALVAAVQAQIAAQRAEVLDLRQTADRLFAGRFPLLRSVGVPRDDGDNVSATIGVGGIAQRRALRNALVKARQNLPTQMLDLVVLVSPDTVEPQQLDTLAALADSEAPLAFGTAANAAVLPGDCRRQLPPTPAWNAPDAAFFPLCRQFAEHFRPGARQVNVMFIVVRAMAPTPTDEYWFQAQRRVFFISDGGSHVAAIATHSQDATQVKFTEGLFRDKSAVLPAIIGVHLLLAVVALALYAGVLGRGGRVVSGWQAWIVPPALGYLLGVALPPMIITGLERVAPDPLASATSAAWWPCAAGALALLLPAIIDRLVARGAASLLGGLPITAHWGANLAAVGCGVGAFWSRHALLSLGWNAGALLVPLCLAAVAVLALLGRAIDRDDPLPAALAVLAVVMAIPFGLGAFLASPPVMWCVALVATAPMAWLLVRQQRAGQRHGGQIAGERAGGERSGEKPAFEDDARVPRTLAELRAAAQSPAYQPLGIYEAASEHLKQFDGGRTVWLALCGASGSGKTATAQALLRALRARHPDLLVLTASCRVESAPYEPFHEALAEVWGGVGSPAAVGNDGQFDAVLHELLGMLVPCWSLLSGLGQAAGGGAVSPHDLFAAIHGTLRRLARKRPVVLLLDDAQWLDVPPSGAPRDSLPPDAAAARGEASAGDARHRSVFGKRMEGSASILHQLRQHLPPGGKLPLLVLLASRDAAKLQHLGVVDAIVKIPMPSPREQASILTASLGLAADSASQIVAALGGIAQEPGGLFWLGRAVAELVDAGAIEAADGQFVLGRGFQTIEKLPIPADLRQELAARLSTSAQHRLVLECAALLGQVFQVSNLAESLAIDRLELLQILRLLEDEMRVLRDVPESDDLYAFSSAFIYEVIRLEFGIDAADGAPARPPKIVRELHARIAAALEKHGNSSPQVIYDLARHYCQAGELLAAKSLAYAVLAARAARAEFTFDSAREYLEMARSAVRPGVETLDLSREALLVDLDEAHVTGRHGETVADRGLDYLAQYPASDHELLVAVARACYEAGRDSVDPQWFGRAARLAQQILDSGRTSAEQAAGLHLLGISLPLERADQRIDSLRRGLARVADTTPRDAGSLLLEARLLGSLAEQLSQGTPAERDEARSLFERGLLVRQANRLGDLPGRARAYGGLGRLAYFGEPPDYSLARQYFEQDLAISEEIGDLAGQSMCCTFLGGCDRAEGKSAAALEHYRRAHAAASSPKDKFYALTGMLLVYGELRSRADLERCAGEWLTLAAEHPIPPGCIEELAPAVSGNAPWLEGPWVAPLAERVLAKRTAEPRMSAPG